MGRTNMKCMKKMFAVNNYNLIVVFIIFFKLILDLDQSINYII